MLQRRTACGAQDFLFVTLHVKDTTSHSFFVSWYLRVENRLRQEEDEDTKREASPVALQQKQQAPGVPTPGSDTDGTD